MDRHPSVWRTRNGLLVVLVIAVCLAAAGAVSALQQNSVRWRSEAHPQTSWAACNRNAGRARPSTFVPLSDAQAAKLVTPEPEIRRDNGRPYLLNGVMYPATNDYVPTTSQLHAFLTSRTSLGQTQLQFNPYYAYVDGHDGMHDPSTDELIQWAAHKWAIPENWLRAEYVTESYWNSFMLGDVETVSAAAYSQYPTQARRGGSSVYQSMGITQVRWIPGGALHPGTEPLRWESTAFNIDYQAATIRFYYDDPDRSRSSWGDASYAPCEKWNSIGGWYDPYPWNNTGQAHYVAAVQQNLNAQTWRSDSFTSWTPGALPGVKLR
jgi:hypothetical protein